MSYGNYSGNGHQNGQPSTNPFAGSGDLIDLELDNHTPANPTHHPNYETSHGRSSAQTTPFADPENPYSSYSGQQAYSGAPKSAYDPFDDHFVLSDEEYEHDTTATGTNSSGRQVPLLNTANQAKEKPGFFGNKRSNSEYIDMNQGPAIQKESDFDIRRIYNSFKSKLPFSSRNPSNIPAVDTRGPRQIFIMNQGANGAFGYFGNYISTTKYNFATFIPKFLFEQFSKYANLFFLFTSIIQQVPHVSPTNRFTTIGTLTIVLLVSAIKEISEDIKRANADRDLNRTRVLVLDPSTGQFVLKKWIQVQVGDVVRVNNEEPFPADLLLLSSSEPEGLCYIETANLDGETNLKIKQATVETSSLVDPRDVVQELSKAEIVSEQPNSSLYTYEGNLKNFGPDGREIPLSPEQLLLRGATLRNTQWIHGVVVFTGHETKLMRNATATPIKKTDVERIINLQIIALFCVLITLALVSSMGNVIKTQVDSDNLGYLYLEGVSKARLFFQDLLTYWILFSNLVPISLFVTVEIIKYYQAYMIGSDLDMYDEETDTPTGVRTSSLVEELGQIDYIFSDKTGTLTRNIMEFKSCSIGGRCYIEEIPEDGHPQIVDGIEIGYHTFDDMRSDLANTSLQQSAIINEFFTLLSTCHTVIPEVNESTGKIKYQAASPDEGALVDGAAELGYKFIIRKPKSVTIENVLSREQSEYELLNICEFNSTRKRMSAVFRCPDGIIRLFCKGADTVILERLSQQEPQPFVTATLRHLEEFAASGLRTLCIASRIVPDDEYKAWAKRYYEASTSLENRGDKLDEVAEQIEKDMFLLGATAIEDKLQDGVPETIHTLQTAGIKIWVLTGDRQETAINIGMSCKLLSEDMNLLIINEETKADTRLNLEEKLSAIQEHQFDGEDGSLDSSLALIIDGHSLSFALEPELEDLFIQLGARCKAVVCCRVSPLQKALVVKMVKRKKKGSLLLAIGDGANDVSMIQAAHVGVGISGQEGMQAARSADVSIGQFKYLKKLLLVHGAWSYQRISNAILYSFYKNITLYMTQFWFVFANCFSGQSIAESWTLTFYNVLFTVLPPFVMGVFDQFVSARLLDRYPQLYQLGQQKKFFNVKIFWGWIINGFYHSAIIFVCSMFIYRYMDSVSSGELTNNWAWGTAVYTTCTLTALGKAGLVVTMWTKFTLIAIPGSFVLWLCWLPAYATIAPLINVSQEYRGVLGVTYPSLTFWSMVFGVSVLCLLRDFAWKYFKRRYSPESYHYVQEIQKYNIQDHRPRMELFQRAIRKVRQVQRIKKQRGFAFSQVENQNQEKIVRLYDTTKKRGTFGELSQQ
ncbi:putative phospholipid-transporting ATPase [Suhomyces tanzawaensis NRRL Y-17324]|uniref:Phospholipid-transporting ATPase n=1 Tax=Suhomyces tanzawaensis NRRL Y-17324 TaxID=984487 RepID=A0A1E4SIV8_9ASCO|nr:putative phospholipid-transporting ATPase [Suhomyces tanzawaensis NRRL Y-17324]ODV79377.1 putative phospholipid-transporting ATPase [Suhomyces tanzawaensis NRRL Y-17324]